MANHTDHPGDHPGNRANHHSKIKAHRRLALKREVAEGKLSQSALAERYGVSPSAITLFKQRYALEIEDIQKNFENEFAGLWIAAKSQRIESYLQDVELIDEQLANNPNPRNLGTLLRYKQNALDSVARELNAYTQRIETNSKVNFTVEGVNMENLK
jgi:transcriptional regulator with XRE-family HTH domain